MSAQLFDIRLGVFTPRTLRCLLSFLSHHCSSIYEAALLPHNFYLASLSVFELRL